MRICGLCLQCKTIYAPGADQLCPSSVVVAETATAGQFYCMATMAIQDTWFMVDDCSSGSQVRVAVTHGFAADKQRTDALARCYGVQSSCSSCRHCTEAAAAPRTCHGPCLAMEALLWPIPACTFQPLDTCCCPVSAVQAQRQQHQGPWFPDNPLCGQLWLSHHHHLRFHGQVLLQQQHRRRH